MSAKIKNLFWRILYIPVSAIFVFQLFGAITLSVNTLLYYLTRESNSYAILRYDVRDTIYLGLSMFWIAALFIFEIAAAFVLNFRFRRTLLNLRHAPFFILFFSTVIVFVFDLGMIEFSKCKIRQYLFSDSQRVEKPEISLHNNYRGWCGNGYSAQENYLYFDTAAEGFNSPNPYVRSRSLLMSAEVRDWLNGGDDRFDDFLAKSCLDSDEIVRQTAENYLHKSDSNCREYLLRK